MASDDDGNRVLVFAPIGRDGPATADILRRAGLTATICTGLADVAEQIEAGAAAAFMAEEGLFGQDITALTNWIERQPPWSDLPFVVLTSQQAHPAILPWRQRLVTALRNVTFLDRPAQVINLTSTMHAACRARARQYEVRALLDARERAAEALEALVRDRTVELETANEALHRQMAERTRAEEALRQSQKIEAVGQLTGGVAHDFNNLLMVISGGLDMLARRDDPARRQILIDGMRQAAQRGAGLTRQLLAFSRRKPLQSAPVDIACQIGSMREMLERSLRGDLRVALDFPDGLWIVEVDPGEFELVVLNLAVNARDAMPQGGTILIRGENLAGVQDGVQDGALRGDFVRLSVIDTGVGMTPEIVARVFEPFFTTKDIGKGSGLGLAQAYGFAQQSGGTIQIASEVGQGSSIMLLLPRSTKALPAGQHHPAGVQAAQNFQAARESVLLVEDDHEVAVLVAEMLDHLGYQVTKAASAAAALGALADGRPIDLVFSDIMMPGGMDGIELAREIRARRQNLPVLLTSGYAEAAKSRAEAAGVSVLPKPYRLNELAAALESALAKLE